MIDSWIFPRLGDTLLFGAAAASGYFIRKLISRSETPKVWFMALNRNAQMHVLREVACDHTYRSFEGLQRVQQRIDGAEKSIDVMMYFLTYTTFKNALLRAKNRGVKLRLILQFDRSDEESEWVRLRRERVPVRVMDVPPGQVQHVEMLIIDQTHVVLGSGEFLGVTENEDACYPEIITAYRNYFNRNWEMMGADDGYRGD